ncbi:MAG: NYN domain-containing protein [Patescibacteria group bacterium]
MTVYVFVDASNLWAAQKSKKKLLDYSKLADFLCLTHECKLVKIFYYDAYPADGTRKYSLDGKHKFYTFLKKGLHFALITKKLKQIRSITDKGEVIVEKGNMDVEITIDALHHMDKYEGAVLFTGDSDFLALVTYLRNHKKKVYIYSSKNNISEELRTGADGYTDILNIAELWGKDLKRREEQ